jgi:cytochrome o ubiquinol oxidase subunit IV
MHDNYLHVSTQADNRAEPAKLFKSYITGFLLSVILAISAFAVVDKHLFRKEVLFFSVGILTLVNLLVQVCFFLRLNARSEEDRWNLIFFIFTLFIILIVVTGSLWIMYNLNYYMVH